MDFVLVERALVRGLGDVILTVLRLVLVVLVDERDEEREPMRPPFCPTASRVRPRNTTSSNASGLRTVPPYATENYRACSCGRT